MSKEDREELVSLIMQLTDEEIARVICFFQETLAQQ